MKNSPLNTQSLRQWAVLWATICCAELLSIFQATENVSADLLMAR